MQIKKGILVAGLVLVAERARYRKSALLAAQEPA